MSKKKKIKLYVARPEFLDYYIQDSDDVNYLAQRVMRDFANEGKIEWSVQEIFDDMGYMPTYIIKNQEDILEEDKDEDEINEDKYKVILIEI